MKHQRTVVTFFLGNQMNLIEIILSSLLLNGVTAADCESSKRLRKGKPIKDGTWQFIVAIRKRRFDNLSI